MKRVKNISLLVTALSTVACKDGVIATIPSGAQAMNVLFIAVDDLKPLIGAYGDPIAKTPNIDRLASQGLLFSSAYCQQALSAPSRASLLTGLEPDLTGVWDLKTLIRDANPNVVTLPEYFKGVGYRTVGIGKIYDTRSVDKSHDAPSWSVPFMDSDDYINPAFDNPYYGHYQSEQTIAIYKAISEKYKEQGYSSSQIKEIAFEQCKPSVECVDIPDDAYGDGASASGIIAQINESSSKSGNFWAVGFKKPHLPFCAPKCYWDLYQREQMPIAEFSLPSVGSPDCAYPGSSEILGYTDIEEFVTSNGKTILMNDEKAQELVHGYYASVSYVDAQIGRILEALEMNGMASNTAIVLWGDHGWHLGDHGLWAKHTNFEQATRAPLIITAPQLSGRVISSPVSFTDIFPTLCELTSVAQPDNLSGSSLLAHLSQDKQVLSSIKPYVVSQYPRGSKMGYSLRSERYRYTIWIEKGDFDTSLDNVERELYDYQSDPHETTNLAGDSNLASAEALMQSYWQDYKVTNRKITDNQN